MVIAVVLQWVTLLKCLCVCDLVHGDVCVRELDCAFGKAIKWSFRRQTRPGGLVYCLFVLPVN